MTLEAELADGRILEFPDGTDPAVIQATVKRLIGGENKTPTITERGQSLLGGVNTGIAGFAGMLVDTAENATNLGIAGYGATKQAFTGKPGPSLIELPGASRDWLKLMEAAGIGTTNPRPDDPTNRMLHTGGAIAGGSMLPGAGVKPALAAATSGALAGEALGPEWIGPAAMAPAAGMQAARTAKGAIAAKGAPQLETFKQAGTMPSVGQLTQSDFFHGLENLAAKFPGGAGVMRNFIVNQQKQFSEKARTGVPTETAGRAIESGITKESGFLDRTKATWKMLDDAVAAKIPPNAAFTPTNTVKALDDLTRPVKGAEASTAQPLDARILQYKDNLAADMANNGGRVSFEGLRTIRSRVGASMDEALVAGAKSGEMKALYAALSKDLEAAAIQAGAGKEFARQNNYYRARMGRVEEVLERVVGNGKQPEDIFKTFYPSDPDQANKVRAVMRSLDPAERKVVSEAVANRLGRAAPGRQDEFGETFSSETFLSNWNKLSPGAKMQLFPEPPLRENMEKIAKAASDIRSGKGIYSNPSGTAGSFAAYAIYTAPLSALGMVVGGTPGALTVAGTAAATAGAARIGAKMLTNPKIVEWLAKPISPATPGAAVGHLARLAVIYNTLDEPTRQEVAAFVKSVEAQ